MLVLFGHEPFWALRSVADEIGPSKGDEIIENRAFAAPYPVNGAIGEFGQPHRLRIDALSLRPPFLRDGLGQLRRH